MKKAVSIVVALLSFLIFSQCQKASINGNLDGRWQIMEIERNEMADNVGEQQLYMNFYLHVCNLSTYGIIYDDGTFSYEDDKLEMFFPTYDYEKDFELLNRYGIYSNPVNFKVEYISSSKLVLKEGDITITLRKF